MSIAASASDWFFARNIFRWLIASSSVIVPLSCGQSASLGIALQWFAFPNEHQGSAASPSVHDSDGIPGQLRLLPRVIWGGLCLKGTSAKCGRREKGGLKRCYSTFNVGAETSSASPLLDADQLDHAPQETACTAPP